ncbi:S9 family peptidase [Halovivax gelatinilyticus]|uniref:S9 family peptidase n=1 Tax=Halovivax gelatinilyticus TaxID=2961597 RepID=UPI0020CA3A29|nr:S9 family peptidase [Halovivax gelatinilyticus]
MSDSTPQTKPYGEWASPITSSLVATAGLTFGHVDVDGDGIYWLEQRPADDGRGVIVRHDGRTSSDVTPPEIDVRTLVHEYGGGDFSVDSGVVYFSRFDDQQVYRQDGDDTIAITPEPERKRATRYADFEVAPGGDRLYCVRESHDVTATDGAENGDRGGETDADDSEPANELVCLPTGGESPPRVVANGHDFYASPRLSPDGSTLAWLTWDHPRMPWDGTKLHVASVEPDGTLPDERVVLGGPDESVFQPAWSPDGELFAVSDRTGWWNLYRIPIDRSNPARSDAVDPLVEREASYGGPQWQLGLSTYAFLDDGRICAIVTDAGRQHVEIIDGNDRTVASLPFETYANHVRSTGDGIVFVAGGATRPTSVVTWTPGAEPEIVRESMEFDVDNAYLATPDHERFEMRDGESAYAYVYPPTNPDVVEPTDDRPPLIAFVHGGPTGATTPTLDLSVQYFTSRGFAVADVNYRGSTGYGRAFREALYGEWGRHDVTDTIDVARHLANSGRADPDRLAVRGGSAGGYLVLSALAFHDAFDAGVSYYGVADLERLAQLTHKFESRYLDQLVGPYPDAADTYRDRSPVEHAGKVDAPVLLLQGEDDPVVPLSQAEAMVEALESNDVAHSLLVFEDERHGFRRAESRERAVEAELAFYADAFGLAVADERNE